MKKIGKVKASKLFRKYQEANLAGSNLLRLTQNSRLNQKIDACIVCNLNEINKLDISTLNHKVLGVYLAIEQQYMKSAEGFQHYLSNTIASFCSKYQCGEVIKGFFVQWNQGNNPQQFVDIVKYAQVKEFGLIIRPKISANNWKDYQSQLATFSNAILQNEYLVLSAISLVLDLPQIQCQNYSKHLLSVWRRTLPAQIGRLIIEDQGEKSRQLRLLFLKNMEMCWMIQYITQNQQRLQQLSEKALGLT